MALAPRLSRASATLPLVLVAMLAWCLLLTAVAASASAAAPASRGSPELPHDAALVAEWKQVEYDWTGAPAGASEAPQFIPANCAITGVKEYQGTYYLTVPRWRPGVPSTLNKLVYKNGRPVLQAYPSWDYQKLGDYSALQYVQSMEIDSFGRMWIIDTGRINFFAANPDQVVNGPPKILVWDIKTNALLREYVFPDSVASYDSSFLNDIVVDEVRGFAYISDSCFNGGIVVYDFEANESWRFLDPSTHPTLSSFVINSYRFNVSTPSDGIALTPDTETLYYSALASLDLYSIPTQYLRNKALSNAQRHTHVHYHGKKLSGSDGMTFDSKGTLYFGIFDYTGIASWDPSSSLSTQQVYVSDSVGMQWVDTFAYGGNDKLIFTTNRLQLYFNRIMNFSDYNFRVWEVTVDGNSYLSAEEQDVPKPSSPPKMYSEGVVVGLAMTVAVLTLALCAVCYGWYRRGKALVQGPYLALPSRAAPRPVGTAGPPPGSSGSSRRYN